MVLKLKNRSENPRKKVLIYGLDGTGKSTFAETYCKENGLNPIVIDIDDTNFTGLDILDLRFANDMQTYTVVKNTIKEIGKTPEYDTIILDGVSSLLEMLTSKAKGMAAYSDRSKRWNDILFELENTHKNLIFIGQIDLEMLFNDDYQPSKAVIKVNSLVNEKYRCYVDDKGQYLHDVKKFRTLEQIEAEAKPQPKAKAPKIEPTPVTESRTVTANQAKLEEPKTEKLQKMVEKLNPFDNAEEIATSIIAELPTKNLVKAYEELIRLNRNGFITDEECPAIKQEIERLLA